MILLVFNYFRLLIAALLLLLEFIVREILSFITRIIPGRLFTSFLKLLPLTSNKAENDPDCDRNSPEIIRSRGFICEEHFVETDDGWILGLHRIPGKKKDEGDENIEMPTDGKPKPVVFFMHGFLQSSEAWLIRKDPNHSLPFILANKGYDVWLGNNRGNTYSHKHRKYSPNDVKYWDFSLDELITHDIPSMINYILKVTKVPKLSYIGFSQGSAQAFGSLSRYSHLSEKINIFIALAPTTKIKGFHHRIVNSFINSKPEFCYLIFGRKSFLSSVLFWRNILTRSLFTYLIDKCNHLLFGWTGNNIDEQEKPALYNHIYSFTSVKVVVHWFQIQQSNHFQMYDDINRGRPKYGYRHYIPPIYQVSNIKCPIALFYGGSDSLPNTSALLDDLKPVYVNKFSKYEHLCFMWGKDAHETVFVEIVDLLEKYKEM